MQNSAPINTKDFPETLYHYTSSTVLLSILSNRSIWLSSKWHLNDSKEGVLFKELMEEIYESNKKKYPNGNPASTNEILEQYGSYVNCLSSDRDMLSQWRGYAGDGSGVSIGLDTATILRLVETNKDKLFLGQVEYVGEGHTLSVQKTGIIKALLKNKVAPSERFISRALKTAWNIKPIAFKEEREYRIILNIPVDPSKNISSSDNIKRGFRAAHDSIREYYEISFAQDDFQKLVKSITLGPKNTSDTKAIEGLLTDRGLANVKVFRSTATYR
ncbi:DUF2971 domain-containing protein [Pseudomonas oryzihabitans]|uniref:DUF2971 domain-containing protein n=1 Tax=Pseudomonas oryzihabitans TaxID=47885 RepID=UPI003CFA116F